MNKEQWQHMTEDIAEVKASQSEMRIALQRLEDSTDQRFEGSDQRFDRIDQRFEGIDQRLDDLDQRFVGFEERMDRRFEEAGKQTAAAIERAIRELTGVFTSQWGRLMEALVEPSCVHEFRSRGIEISRTNQRVKGIDSTGRQSEVDVLLGNGEEVVAIEVKSVLKVRDVNEIHLNR